MMMKFPGKCSSRLMFNTLRVVTVRGGNTMCITVPVEERDKKFIMDFWKWS